MAAASGEPGPSLTTKSASTSAAPGLKPSGELRPLAILATSEADEQNGGQLSLVERARSPGLPRHGRSHGPRESSG